MNSNEQKPDHQEQSAEEWKYEESFGEIKDNGYRSSWYEIKCNDEWFLNVDEESKAIEICSRFNELDSLKTRLAKAGELPSDDEIRKLSFDDERILNLDLSQDYPLEIAKEGMKFMRSRASETIAKLKEENNRLRDDNTDLKVHLLKYCVHREACDLMYGTTDTGKCSCGLDALLTNK